MLSDATTETKQLLMQLRQGDVYEAIEAAKSLSSLPRLSPRQIIEVLNETKAAHNREAAVYALSWLFRKDKNESLQTLLNVFNNVNENPRLRGLALEGMGLQRPTKRCKLWHKIEAAVLQGLNHKAVDVRFWACYAAGTLRMKSALPKLREVAGNDSEICPNWWRVS